MKKLQLTYGYDDVTLVPAYSELKSRSEANPAMHNYKLPIIASCMDTLGKDLMDEVISNEIPFIAHRAFKSAKEQYNYFIPNDEIDTDFYEKLKYVWFAVGSVQKYRDWIDYLFERGVRHFCVDMAHGDSKTCIDTIEYIRERAKGYCNEISRLNQVLHIIAGNVATAEGFKRLQNAGANGIRIGIASGQICFSPDTNVWYISPSGKLYQKAIKFIEVGDKVLTAFGDSRKVVKLYQSEYKGEMYRINKDVLATPTHKFYTYNIETHEKMFKPIKDVDDAVEMFIKADGKMEKAVIELEEYNGTVYNIEVDDQHCYCVGEKCYGVSNCSTALQTGFGVPILTNIIECSKVRKNGTWIIADGGVKTTGDIAKAVYFGADFCMIGKLFAATDKACGKCYNRNKEEIKLAVNPEYDEPNFYRPIYPEEFDNLYRLAEEWDWKLQDAACTRKNLVRQNLVSYKGYHGMASRDARAGVLSYASVEGVAGMVKYSGTTAQFINDTYLRLQASLSYAGAKDWNEFRKKTYPVMRSNAGIIAGETHLDITTDR